MSWPEVANRPVCPSSSSSTGFDSVPSLFRTLLIRSPTRWAFISSESTVTGEGA